MIIYNQAEVEEAKAIILKSLKSNGRKLLTEFRGWEKLDYNARVQAISELSCIHCRKLKPLVGTIQNPFGTDASCWDCSDQNNYPHLFGVDGRRLPFWEIKTTIPSE